MDLRIKAVLSGLSTYLPGRSPNGFTGGTDSARYCYSVWLRHLVLAMRHTGARAVPAVVAELGPGDSIGIGLAALLSGAQRYIALDLVRYSDLKRNLAVLDELVEMFAGRSPIPDESEFPSLLPKLDSYEFPIDLIGEVSLREALAPRRLLVIKSAIENAHGGDSMVAYKAPWNAPDVIDDGSIDLIFSQAVLEHVDDLRGIYAATRRWLKPGALMTHQIDFRCHGKANEWNGHWTYSDRLWKIIVGRRAYLLNRQPHSVHVRLIEQSGFRIREDSVTRSTSDLRRERLATEFRALSDDDLTVSAAFIVAVVADGN
ncbi:MAG TPA: methyltransferase domain-containing protein [Steroidobacteraceae bacterium]|nr:methyltransferase domain-containing protein [Steroidobacteraceae bacterium]